MKTRATVTIIAYALIFLFVYTALSKLFLYTIYVSDLGRSPFISDFAKPLSILLPAVELLITLMLLFPATRKRGLIASAILMFMFTAYVAAMLLTQENLPCTCGGLIRELTWRQHLIFNIVFTLAAVWAAWRIEENGQKTNLQIQPS